MPIQVEVADASRKHPPESWIPLAKVEDAVVEVTLKTDAESPPAKVEVPCPTATVIAPAKVLVAVDVETMEPKVPSCAKSDLTKELVVVPEVVVLLVMVSEANEFAPEKVLASARSVEDADEPEVERQVPAMEKQPVVREIPLAKVEVPEVMASAVAEMPPPNVLVPCPAPTVIAPPKVEVAVVVPVKNAATTCPTTERRAYGEVVPIPRKPEFAKVRTSPLVAVLYEKILPVPIWVVDASATDDDAKIESGVYTTEPSESVSRVKRSHWVYLVSVPASVI